jgi:hypothetical protein
MVRKKSAVATNPMTLLEIVGSNSKEHGGHFAIWNRVEN